MITIIDYGLGNVLAFSNVYKRLNIPAALAKSASDLHGATKLILPGVGAFDHAMELLQQSGMRETLDEMVLSSAVPVLGVCVGMQILAASSEEGRARGLGWIDGDVRKFDVASFRQRTRLPHMGWNDVKPVGPSALFGGLESDARFYFLHSYYFHCARSENVLAQAEYGTTFACAVQARQIFGVQFHPEKSHRYGTRLLKNFAEL
jgi:glutamine amidotransferase